VHLRPGRIQPDLFLQIDASSIMEGMVVNHSTPLRREELPSSPRRQFTLSGMLWMVTACSVLFAGVAAWWRYDLPVPMVASAVLFGCFCDRLAGRNGIFGGAVAGTLSGASIGFRWAMTDDYADILTITLVGSLAGALTAMNLLALEATARGFYRALRIRP